MIDRRTFNVFALGASAAFASTASACSPPLPNGDADFFSAIFDGEDEAAIRALAPDAKLFVLDPAASRVIAGPKNILAEFKRLAGQKYVLALAGEDSPGIAPSEEYGPWQRYTVWRELEGGGFVNETTCGPMSDSYDLLLYGTPITSIALVRAPLPSGLLNAALSKASHG